MTSHGCINLSPKDARRVYEWTSPETPAGWLTVREHEGASGTLLRVRKDHVDVRDYRD